MEASQQDKLAYLPSSYPPSSANTSPTTTPHSSSPSATASSLQLAPPSRIQAIAAVSPREIRHQEVATQNSDIKQVNTQISPSPTLLSRTPPPRTVRSQQRLSTLFDQPRQRVPSLHKTDLEAVHQDGSLVAIVGEPSSRSTSHRPSFLTARLLDSSAEHNQRQGSVSILIQLTSLSGCVYIEFESIPTPQQDPTANRLRRTYSEPLPLFDRKSLLDARWQGQSSVARSLQSSLANVSILSEYTSRLALCQQPRMPSPVVDGFAKLIGIKSKTPTKRAYQDLESAHGSIQGRGGNWTNIQANSYEMTTPPSRITFSSSQEPLVLPLSAPPIPLRSSARVHLQRSATAPIRPPQTPEEEIGLHWRFSRETVGTNAVRNALPARHVSQNSLGNPPQLAFPPHLSTTGIVQDARDQHESRVVRPTDDVPNHMHWAYLTRSLEGRAGTSPRLEIPILPRSPSEANEMIQSQNASQMAHTSTGQPAYTRAAMNPHSGMPQASPEDHRVAQITATYAAGSPFPTARPTPNRRGVELFPRAQVLQNATASPPLEEEKQDFDNLAWSVNGTPRSSAVEAFVVGDSATRNETSRATRSHTHPRYQSLLLPPSASLTSSTTSSAEDSKEQSFLSHSEILGGVVSEGLSTRPMSEEEFFEAISEITTSHEGKKAASDQAAALQGELGPGSSQSISSDGREGRAFTKNNSPVKNRIPTPPMLYGRNQLSFPEAGPSFKRLASNSRINKDSRLGGTVITSDNDDWETEIGVEEDIGGAKLTAGSSLADNSDSSSLSANKQSLLQRRAAHHVQNAAHPRYNQAWVLHREAQSGLLEVMSEDKVQLDGGHYRTKVPTEAVMSWIGKQYRHPTPLSFIHQHPFLSSSSSAQRPAVGESHRRHNNGDQQGSQEQEETYRHVSSGRDLTSQQSKPTIKTRDLSGLSTLQEAYSDEHSLPVRDSSFGRMNYFGAEDNIAVTPEDTRMKEAGSSLANASSPAEQFSSSPAARSPYSEAALASNACYEAFEEVLEDHHNDLQSHHTQFGSSFHQQERSLRSNLSRVFSPLRSTPTRRHRRRSYVNAMAQNRSDLPADPYEPSLFRTGSQESATEDVNAHPIDWPTAYRTHLPAQGRRNNTWREPSRTPRSPSENSSQINTPLSIGKPSVLTTPPNSSHGQQRGEVNLLNAAEDGENEFVTPSAKSNGHRKFRSTSVHPSQPNLTRAAPYSVNETGHIQVPSPVHVRPVRGANPPWEQQSSDRPARQFDRSNQPVASATRPHLHRIPLLDTPQLRQREKRLSLFFLIVSMAVPGLSLIYGWNRLDWVMHCVSHGDFSNFTPAHKIIARAYSIGGLCVVAIMVSTVTGLVAAARDAQP